MSSAWQQWRDHPEKSWLRQVFFQGHLWIGAAASGYFFVISLSGSILVYRNKLPKTWLVKWLVDLHQNLLTGSLGRVVNGMGALCLTLLCLTGAAVWWPGIAHWRRSLTVAWRARFPRLNWDLHSALGFWFFPFVLVWGLSAVYFVFPQPFDLLLWFDPEDRFTDTALSRLSQLHFGRFGWLAEAVWALAGLVLAVLAFTGTFICCRRVIFNKPSNPKHAST
jgi:uncharacterized iron-regulated membrane protein